MGKLQERLVTGKIEDFNFVKAHSDDLVRELVLEQSGHKWKPDDNRTLESIFKTAVNLRGAKTRVAEQLKIAPSALSNILRMKQTHRGVPKDALMRLMAELQKEAKKNEPVEKTPGDNVKSTQE